MGGAADRPVCVVVDSSSGVGPDLAGRWGLSVVPMYVTWEGATFREGVDLLPEDFYRRLEELDENPRTAAPSPADFAAAYRERAAAGYRHVVVVAPSAKLSGIAQNAALGARDVEDVAVTVVDSRQGAGSQALVAAHAASLAAAGAGAVEVAAAGEAAADRAGVWMCMDTLRYLRRSGRISAARAIAGDALGIKPIVSFVDGALQVVDRPRTRSRATERLLGRLAGPAAGARRLLALFSDDPADGDELAARLRQRFTDNGVEIESCAISAVVGGSCGSGTRGVAALWA